MIFIRIVALTHSRFKTYIFAVLLLLIFVWFTFAVLQVSCENQTTTTHSTQFMLSTEERSVLYLYSKFEGDSSIRSEVIRGPKFCNCVTWPRPRSFRGPFILHTLERSILYICTKFEADSSTLLVQKLIGFPKFWTWVTWPGPRPLGVRCMIHT